MATIPRIESASLLAQPTQLARQRPGYGIAQGLDSAARNLDTAAEYVDQRDNARDIAWVTKQHSDDRLWATTRLNELIDQAPPDGAGVSAQLQKEMAQRGAVTLQGAPSEQARFLFEQKHEEIRNNALVDSQVYEAKARGAYTIQQLNEGAASSAAYLALHPEDLDKIKTEYAASTQALAKRGRMNAEVLAQHDQKVFALFAQSAAGGRIETAYEDKSIPRLKSTLTDLREGKYPDLEADDTLRLRANAESRINSLEAEQRAAASEADTLAGEMYRDAREVVRGGGLPDTKALLTVTRGTKYEDQAKQLIGMQAQLTQFASAPLPAQAQALQAVEQQVSSGGISTGDDIVRRDLMRSSYSNATQAVKDGDGIGVYAQRHGVDLGDPIADAPHREAVAADATAWAGGVPQLPMTDTELTTLQSEFANADAVKATGDMVGLANLYPQSRTRLAEALAKKDASFGVALAIAGDPQATPVVTSILAGRKILAGSATDFKPKRADLVAAVPSDVVDAFAGHDVAFNDMVDAATAVYVSKYGARGAEVSPEKFAESIHAITGAPIQFNDTAILPPVRGMTEEQLWSDMRNLTPADLLKYGAVKVPNSNALAPATEPPHGDVGLWLPVVGAPEPNKPVTTDDILNYGTLVDVGEGFYQIKMGPGVLLTDHNEPYLLNLANYHEAAATRPTYERPMGQGPVVPPYP